MIAHHDDLCGLGPSDAEVLGQDLSRTNDGIDDERHERGVRVVLKANAHAFGLVLDLEGTGHRARASPGEFAQRPSFFVLGHALLGQVRSSPITIAFVQRELGLDEGDQGRLVVERSKELAGVFQIAGSHRLRGEHLYRGPHRTRRPRHGANPQGHHAEGQNQRDSLPALFHRNKPST